MNLPVSHTAQAISAQPIVRSLRVADGVRLDTFNPEMAPTEATRNTNEERLFTLLTLTGQDPRHAYARLQEEFAHIYWTTPGSITAALREAVAGVNRHLFRENLRSEAADRLYAHLAALVLAGDDLFVLRAGAAWVGISGAGQWFRILPMEKMGPLGIAALADVHLAHVHITPQATLLAISPGHARLSDEAVLSRILQRESLEALLEELMVLSPFADFAALAIRWEVGATETGHRTLLRKKRAQPLTVETPTVAARPTHAPTLAIADSGPQPTTQPRPAPVVPTRTAPAASTAGPKEQFGDQLSPSRQAVGAVARSAVQALSRGLAGLGATIGNRTRDLFWNILPGPAPEPAQRQVRMSRAVPAENRTAMMILATAIPIILCILVLFAYTRFGISAQFNTLLAQAREQVELAVATTGSAPADARRHWENVLSYTERAAALKPGDAAVESLRQTAENALDQLDKIQRVQPTLLYDFGPMRGNLARRLIVRGQTIFVLDPGNGWMAKITLSPDGGRRIEEGEMLPVIVRTGQTIGGAQVGDLVDFAWVNASGGRRTSNILILEQGGQLIAYDPAWSGTGGEPQLARLNLGDAGGNKLVRMRSFDGRLYFLEPARNQIWRYLPQEDAYPSPPEAYFPVAPPIPLESAVDFAVDGDIYVLYTNGQILKFHTGQLVPFEVHGLSDNLSHPVALAVDPTGSTDVIYVADQNGKRCNGRIVAIQRDGTFRVQYCADGMFDAIETIDFDPAAGHLCVISGGRLYVMRLP